MVRSGLGAARKLYFTAIDSGVQTQDVWATEISPWVHDWEYLAQENLKNPVKSAQMWCIETLDFLLNTWHLKWYLTISAFVYPGFFVSTFLPIQIFYSISVNHPIQNIYAWAAFDYHSIASTGDQLRIFRFPHSVKSVINSPNSDGTVTNRYLAKRWNLTWLQIVPCMLCVSEIQIYRKNMRYLFENRNW